MIINFRATTVHKFRARLGFKQYYVILSKEQSMLTKIKSSFEKENMQTQYSALVHKTDLLSHGYKLAIETYENNHSNKNIGYEQERGCKFIRIDLDKGDFNIFKAINEIFRHIQQSSNQLAKQSTKTTLTDKISIRLLGLKFK